MGTDGKQHADKSLLGDDNFPLTVSSISGNGRFVAFESWADGMAPNDDGGLANIFVRDRKKGTTVQADVGLNGLPPVGIPTATKELSYEPSISRDGRYVAFTSLATNLVQGDSNLSADVFVRDLAKGITERVSLSGDGEESFRLGGSAQLLYPSISGDGQAVAFMSNATNMPKNGSGMINVFVRDSRADKTIPVSMAMDGESSSFLFAISGYPSISSDGGHVAFSSNAPNLVADDTNVCASGGFVNTPGTCEDVFVRDLAKGVTERASVDSHGREGMGGIEGSWSMSRGGKAISRNGRYVAFWSEANNLVPNDGTPGADIFVHDMATGLTDRVSVDRSGAEASDIGRESYAISDDGRFVAYQAYSSDLAEDDSGAPCQTGPCDDFDVFVYDRVSGSVDMVSRNSKGQESRGCVQESFVTGSYIGGISADGRFVSFSSCGSNLTVGKDENPGFDVFVRDRGVDVGAGVSNAHGATLRIKDATGDVMPDVASADLTSVDLALRPGTQDLFVRERVSDLWVGRLMGARPVVGLRFEVAGVSYEARAEPAAGDEGFNLYSRDESGWSFVGALRGGYGTSGEAVTFSIPLDLFPAHDVGRIWRAAQRSEAFTAPAGSAPGDDDLILDRAAALLLGQGRLRVG